MKHVIVRLRVTAKRLSRDWVRRVWGCAGLEGVLSPGITWQACREALGDKLEAEAGKLYCEPQGRLQTASDLHSREVFMVRQQEWSGGRLVLW